MKKIFFAFPSNRAGTVNRVENGFSPDNELYGLNHLKKFGLETEYGDAYPPAQRILDLIFIPLYKLFQRQIDIGFHLGRAILLLPKMNRADIVITNTDSIGLPVCLLKRLRFIKPSIIYAVGLFYIQGGLKTAVDSGRPTLFRRFYVWVLSAAEHIIYHSPIEKEKLVKLGVYNPAYCTFIAMGSDGRFFQRIVKRLGLASQGLALIQKPVILSVGRDHARDYKTLFETAEKLPDIKFVVICSQRNIEGLKIPNNAKILFDLSYKKVASWYGRATAVMIPMKEMHRSSGQMTLTDAMQAGKAIIASDVVGISHYGLRSEKDALLVPPGNLDLLKKAIAWIVDNNNLRRRLETQTKKLAKIFTTENYAKNISEAVEWTIDPIKLRPLRQKDLEFSRRLRNENRQYFFDDNYISRQDQLKWFENYQKKTEDFMFVLENNGVRVGIGAIYHIDWSKKSAEIGRFVIGNKFRNQGFAKELIKKIEILAGGEMNLNKLILKVLHQNHSAINVYKKMGYTKNGVRKFAGRTIVKMKKVLQSPHAEKK